MLGDGGGGFGVGSDLELGEQPVELCAIKGFVGKTACCQQQEGCDGEDDPVGGGECDAHKCNLLPGAAVFK
jgi:hypothetical protein